MHHSCKINFLMFKVFKNTKSILITLVLLAYVGLFFPLNVSNVTLIALLAFSLVKTKPKEFIESIRKNSYSQVMIGIYLLLIIGLLYTSDMKSGLFVLEKKMSFLLIPLLVLPILQREKVTDRKVFIAIGLITIASSIILLVVALYKTLVLHDTDAFFYENFTSIHYVYYSLYFAFGSLLLIESLLDEMIIRPTGIIIISLLFIYSLGVLIYVASKTGIMIYCISSVIIFFMKIKNKKIFIISIILMIGSASILFYFNKTSRSRFEGLTEHLSVLTSNDLASEGITITDLNMRLLFWKLSLIDGSADYFVWLGLGTGDVQTYLDGLYTKNTLYGYLGYDTHNEWIFTWLQLGLPGIIVVGFLFVKFLRDAYFRRDLKFMIFLLITLAFSQSESILESNKGIVFFVLFFTLFCVPYKKESISIIANRDFKS